jgi:2-polyprenyl-3-methyl-5-hydroxy-6-metoxy-1,4-benzoquinol methylase
MTTLSQKEAYKMASEYQFDTPSLLLGPWTSYSLLNDPKHMCFVLARYKFCAKILLEKKNILEIGCGDGFGIPIIAQGDKNVLGVDVDDRLIEGNRQRLKKIKNIEFQNFNICEKAHDKVFDAIFSIDVIEHLDPNLENNFIKNSCKSLHKDGIYIIGTPNITSQEYATERSRVQHINLKSFQELKNIMKSYFINSFIFSMNDEVIHTGFHPMAHYLFAVGVGKK